MSTETLVLGIVALGTVAAWADPLAPDPVEVAWLRTWFDAAFLAKPAPPPEPRTGLLVRRQDYSQLTRGRSVMDTPLRVGNRAFEHGLGTHAVSEVLVTLPGPGARFTAQVGVDNNYDTAGQRGSVEFSVDLAGKQAWSSGLVKGGQEPVAATVELAGAREFVLHVGDGGDGPGWDQSDWCDPVATLTDGTRVRLDELPFLQRPVAPAPGLPFSFRCGGKPSAELLAAWPRRVDGNRIVWTAPDGLQVACTAVWYDDVAACEWVVELTNTGATESPLIEQLQALDLGLTLPARNGTRLLHARGSTCEATDFLPLTSPLEPDAKLALTPGGGRSSNGVMPFWNLAWPGGGLVGAVGWSGQWQARFERDGDKALQVVAGQQTTHFRLRPGETARTPSLLLAAWSGDDPQRGQNRLRRAMIAHVVPRHNGQVLWPPVSQNTWFEFHEGNDVTEANQLVAMAAMHQAGVESFWLDAGWFEGGWPHGVGSWTPKPTAFPHGLKPLGDAARDKGMGFVLWFEPERVDPQSRIGREHPEFVLHAGGGDGLFNLGDAKARQWLTDHLNRCISEWGITCYRNDFNIDPLGFWQAADTPERVGLSENHYIQGLYRLWDDLLAAHPGLLIDNCASGGRRIDLETCRRSVPLWHSDTQCCGKAMPIQDQTQTIGLTQWVPLHAAGVWAFDPYTWRSVATAGTSVCPHVPDDQLAALRARVAETKALRPLWLGDFYPLLPVDQEVHGWCGWQLDRPDLGEGAVYVFRRAASPYPVVEVAAQGLPADATWKLQDLDSGAIRTVTTAELGHLRVELPAAGAAVLRYHRQ